MRLPPPLLQPGGSAARSWARFSARPAAVLASITLFLVFLVAAFAPFLSEDLPFSIETDEGRSWPFFRRLSGSDIAWLVLVFSAALGYVARRCGLRWTRSFLLAFVVFVIGFAASFQRTPQHESRRYRVEQADRTRIAQSDESLHTCLESGRLKEAREVLRELRRDLSGYIAGEEALEARWALLDAAEPSLADFDVLRARNRLELDRLEEAIFPLNRFAPDQPSFDGLMLPAEARGQVLGSDENGRDLLARLIHGARIAMSMAVASTALVCLLGVGIGLMAGWFGGAIDWLLQRTAEVVLCLPVLFVLVAFAAYLPLSWRQSPLFIALFIGLILWPNMARIVRAEVMRLKAMPYVQGAVGLGLSRRRVFLKHLLPNILGPVLIAASITAGQVILIESTLSFLGLGQESRSSWGRILAESRETVLLQSAWHLALFPGLPLTAVILAFHVLGDQIRDAIDPRAES